MPQREHIYKADGVILRRRDLGEADRIITLFTQEFGKIRVVAKGVKKPTSRKAGFVELFAHVSAVISVGSSLDILSQVDTIEGYPHLRSNLELTTYALHFCELVDSFTEDEDANPALYSLLATCLRQLDAGVDMRLISRYFEMHLLRLEGFLPELYTCAVCGNELEPADHYFSVKDGGVVCSRCGEETRGYRPLSLGALKVMRYFLKGRFEEIRQLTISQPVHHDLELLHFEMLTFNLERRLKSAAFIKRLRREAGE